MPTPKNCDQCGRDLQGIGRHVANCPRQKLGVCYHSRISRNNKCCSCGKDMSKK